MPHGYEKTPVGQLIKNLRSAGMAPVLRVDRHIVEGAGLSCRRYRTQPVHGWAEATNTTTITGWKEEDWVPLWAAALIAFHRRPKFVLTKMEGQTVVPEIGYKEMTELLRSYKDSEDSTYAALAAAALCEDKEVAKLAQDAIKLPLYGVQGTPGL